MKTPYIFLVGLFILMSCNPTIKQNPSNEVEVKPEVAFEVDENDLIPEGIAYDSKTKRFFLSSKNKDKIIAVYPSGKHVDFIKTRQDSMLGSLGLKVDAERRRLWTLSNRMFGDQQVSVVHVFDVDSGKLLKRFFAPSDRQYLLNDLVITCAGGAYITDTRSSYLFKVPSNLSELKVFAIDTLIQAPNGITISPDNSILYVESHYNGIILIDLKEKSIQAIGNPMFVETGGIDGLMYYKNSLVGIANSQHEDFEYIVRYQLSEDGREITAASIIDKANPAFNIPTTGVIANDSLFVLAATCLDVYNRNKMDQKELLTNPLVLKYALN